jgi:hypothetical protein
MENMKHEGRERVASTTPTLDGILSKLPPLSLRQEMQIKLGVGEEAKKRLSEKMETRALTQSIIEQELNSLPDVEGIETTKEDLVDFIRMNLPYEYNHDVKKLPL